MLLQTGTAAVGQSGNPLVMVGAFLLMGGEGLYDLRGWYISSTGEGNILFIVLQILLQILEKKKNPNT